MANPLKLSEFRKQRQEVAGLTLDLEDGGDPVVIPPPERWPELKKSVSSDELVKLLVGDDVWQRIQAAGVTGREIDVAITEKLKASRGE